MWRRHIILETPFCLNGQCTLEVTWFLSLRPRQTVSITALHYLYIHLLILYSDPATAEATGTLNAGAVTVQPCRDKAIDYVCEVSTVQERIPTVLGYLTKRTKGWTRWYVGGMFFWGKKLFSKRWWKNSLFTKVAGKNGFIRGKKVVCSFTWEEKQVCFWLGEKKKVCTGAKSKPPLPRISSGPPLSNVVTEFPDVLWNHLRVATGHHSKFHVVATQAEERFAFVIPHDGHETYLDGYSAVKAHRL